MKKFWRELLDDRVMRVFSSNAAACKIMNEIEANIPCPQDSNRDQIFKKWVRAAADKGLINTAEEMLIIFLSEGNWVNSGDIQAAGKTLKLEGNGAKKKSWNCIRVKKATRVYRKKKVK